MRDGLRHFTPGQKQGSAPSGASKRNGITFQRTFNWRWACSFQGGGACSMEDTKPTINVLAVSAAAEDQVSLRAIFTHSRWRLSEAASCADAISLLTADPVPILIVNAILPDATWRDLLTRVSAL